ncbi:hypothetical protein ElyMa_003971700 [Elysia marginata]|uniref:Uncharacterized protein n=1 Tax=Elysia marginata TaxID=1093978 RepID=A0AAV4FYY2_9GAST|nr:hypothetical protein ElyMa_003971700 [Elysia marginata]
MTEQIPRFYFVPATPNKNILDADTETHLPVYFFGGGLVIPHRWHRLCGLAVRHSFRDRDVRSSIPGRDKPGTLKLVLAADPPSVWRCGFSVQSGRPGVRIMWLGVCTQALITSQCGSTLSASSLIQTRSCQGR